ncbi:hypothetical protein V1504DRAFT_33070 [Lipomyces starkeyi]
MATDEEIRVREMRSTILANEPDHEHESKLSEESYNQLRTEFDKEDEDDNSYSVGCEIVTSITNV